MQLNRLGASVAWCASNSMKNHILMNLYANCNNKTNNVSVAHGIFVERFEQLLFVIIIYCVALSAVTRATRTHMHAYTHTRINSNFYSKFVNARQ